MSFSIEHSRAYQNTKAMLLGAASILGVDFALEESAHAASTGANLPVTASVVQSCAHNAVPMVFGTYDPVNQNHHKGSTDVIVHCTHSTPYHLGLDQGAGAGATEVHRKMTSSTGAHTLTYHMFQDSARLSHWGNQVGINTVPGTGTGLPVTHTIHSHILANQTVPAGAYTDMVSVTITY